MAANRHFARASSLHALASAPRGPDRPDVATLALPNIIYGPGNGSFNAALHAAQGRNTTVVTGVFGVALRLQ